MYGGSQQLPDALQAFLDELDHIAWFRNVRQPINDDSVTQVFSWEEAWECLQDDSYTYAPVHYGIDQGHDAWVAAYDKAHEVISKAGPNHEFEENISVADQVAYDAGCAAYEIATGTKHGFFGRMMDWYRKGHWPCGWDGKYPEGKLIVY